MTPLVLTRPHTHAGKTYGVGDRIEIDATSADWLIAQGIATPQPTPPTAEPIPEPKPLQRKEMVWTPPPARADTKVKNE